MTTQEKSSSIQVEKDWEFKDRVYVLAGNHSPVTYTIQTKHTPRKPLLWFDEGLKINRELRLATNQKSLFADEQNGYSTLTHVIFQDGVLNVPRTEVTMQKMLSLYHPLKGNLWIEADAAKDAEDEIDLLEFEMEALNLVQTLDIEHLEAIMRTELGSAVSTMSSRELKRDAYRFAKSQPALFIEISEDEDIKLRNLANRAVEQGVILLTDDNTVFKFANGKKILTVPFEQHPYAALSQYFKTDDGVMLMKSLTKKLN
ncbi:MAG: hypothetical protein ACKVI2_03960 [Candidatus Pelagibacterales bacterium]|jgi:hypothetical protein|tara:strand:- start:313 stop:1086 length:774 start_codon:yes stop_codon:yes gene_type:complete